MGTQTGKGKKVITILGLVVLIILAATLFVTLILAGYNYAWTGFGNFTSPQGEFQRGKTLWDWMELLIVPIILALGALLFTQSQRKADLEIAARRDQTERDIATDRIREDALQSYFELITGLMLEKNLCSSNPGDEVRDVARARTLAILPGLDGVRKGAVVKYLHVSGLINKDKPIVDLHGADLSEANLYESNLEHADLSEVNLRDAILVNAKLVGVNLARARLERADMTNIDLSFAEMHEAYLMRACLESANLYHAYLLYSHLFEAKLVNANLCNAYLQKADLMAANLEDVNLYVADLEGASLMGARLRNARLGKANLVGVYLTDTDLTGADLEAANLEGSNLYGAKVTNDQLSSAKSLKGVIIPDGTQHE